MVTKNDVNSGLYTVEKFEGKHQYVMMNQREEASENVHRSQMRGAREEEGKEVLVVWQVKHRWLPPLFPFKIITVLFHEASLACGIG